MDHGMGRAWPFYLPVILQKCPGSHTVLSFQGKFRKGSPPPQSSHSAPVVRLSGGGVPFIAREDRINQSNSVVNMLRKCSTGAGRRSSYTCRKHIQHTIYNRLAKLQTESLEEMCHSIHIMLSGVHNSRTEPNYKFTPKLLKSKQTQDFCPLNKNHTLSTIYMAAVWTNPMHIYYST